VAGNVNVTGPTVGLSTTAVAGALSIGQSVTVGGPTAGIATGSPAGSVQTDGQPPRDLILTGSIEPGRWFASIDPDELTGTPADQSPWTAYLEPARWVGSISPDRYLGTLETG
jgi:hypothetical protein